MTPAGSDVSVATLTQAQDRLIAAWGQMGSTWGISRTMAEIHALLYITGRPMNTDEVMERLNISRGNASMSLRALLDWSIVSRLHKRGDRKEYFQAEQDVWAIARQIIRERLRREVHPVLASLFEIRELTTPGAAAAMQIRSASTGAAATDGPAPVPDVAEHNERLDTLLELLQTIDRLAERFVGADAKGLQLAATLLSRVS
ncbi:MAG: hypothetical protein KF745_09175 [Phycisphaeraceae bacterium]|nr:hypothetical protein [Phycisphaeraceae bacterium]